MFGRQNLFERISGVILTASDAADMSARQTCGTLPAVDNATPMPVETVCDPPDVEGRYLTVNCILSEKLITRQARP